MFLATVIPPDLALRSAGFGPCSGTRAGADAPHGGWGRWADVGLREWMVNDNSHSQYMSSIVISTFSIVISIVIIYYSYGQ